MQKTVLGFDESGGLPVLARHTFLTSDRGELLHEVDGRLRATVPPEGWADYVKQWPEAGDIVDSLRIVPAAVVTSAPEAQVQTAEEKIAILEAALAAAIAANKAPEAVDEVAA